VVQVLLGVAQQGDLALDRGAERMELLPDRHGHRVLQLGPAHLHDRKEGITLLSERSRQLLQFGS
jgi:hypothetical protein